MPFFPEEASSYARHVDALYWFLVAVTAFFSLLIGGLVVYFAIRYRRRTPTRSPSRSTSRCSSKSSGRSSLSAWCS